MAHTDSEGQESKERMPWFAPQARPPAPARSRVASAGSLGARGSDCIAAPTGIGKRFSRRRFQVRPPSPAGFSAGAERGRGAHQFGIVRAFAAAACCATGAFWTRRMACGAVTESPPCAKCFWTEKGRILQGADSLIVLNHAGLPILSAAAPTRTKISLSWSGLASYTGAYSHLDFDPRS
jgi:hypothetical protein